MCNAPPITIVPNKTRLDILEDKVGGGDYASQERLSKHQLACCCKHNVLLNGWFYKLSASAAACAVSCFSVPCSGAEWNAGILRCAATAVLLTETCNVGRIEHVLGF